MAPVLTDHAAITAVQTVSGNTDLTESVNEKASQTFVFGVPVQLNAGVVQEWDGATVAIGIAGFSMEDAHNLASDGLGAPGPFTGVGFPGTGTTFGKVPYEASAVNIPRGAPFVTGQILFNAAVEDTIFRGQFDRSGAGSATTVQSDIGKQFGMTKDASGHWYVDRDKVTVGTNTVVEVVALDPITGPALNGFVYFKVVRAASQYQ